MFTLRFDFSSFVREFGLYQAVKKWALFQLGRYQEEIAVAVAIDDIHPEKGWGLPGDDCMMYLDRLYQEFGVRFTLFIPSCYHEAYPVSQFEDWIAWLRSLGYFELAEHGHYHKVFKVGSPGECEFSELDGNEAMERVADCLSEWKKMGISELGWRSPGWLTSDEAFRVLEKTFVYMAIHPVHNRHQSFSGYVFRGIDSIHANDAVLYGNGIQFQSHINGPRNDNNWNEKNYLNFRENLLNLHKSYTCRYVTFKDIL